MKNCKRNKCIKWCKCHATESNSPELCDFFISGDDFSDSAPVAGSVSESSKAFDEWIGPGPTSGCGRSIIAWKYEVEKLWDAWEAGRKFAQKAQKQNDKISGQ